MNWKEYLTEGKITPAYKGSSTYKTGKKMKIVGKDYYFGIYLFDVPCASGSGKIGELLLGDVPDSTSFSLSVDVINKKIYDKYVNFTKNAYERAGKDTDKYKNWMDDIKKLWVDEATKYIDSEIKKIKIK